MTMKKAKRRMMARKGKMIRTMMTRERDSLTSLNLLAPHIEHDELQDEEQHAL